MSQPASEDPFWDALEEEEADKEVSARLPSWRRSLQPSFPFWMTAPGASDDGLPIVKHLYRGSLDQTNFHVGEAVQDDTPSITLNRVNLSRTLSWHYFASINQKFRPSILLFPNLDQSTRVCFHLYVILESVASIFTNAEDRGGDGSTNFLPADISINAHQCLETVSPLIITPLHDNNSAKCPQKGQCHWYPKLVF